jgi:NADPH:quinone reductase-like Zn-dependent oxidoreductase
MKAIVVEHLGEAGSLKEIPVPKPGSHEILVRVTAAGVNPVDWKQRNRPDTKFPLILGRDFAGVVSEPGTRVTNYREGERLFGIARTHGTYAEYTIVSEDDRAQPIAKIPEDVGDADAAALPTAGLTALASLDALQLAKDATLLVLGATGGVGGFAVQIARDRGVHVIGTARASSEAFARSLGVDEFVAYDARDVVASVKAAHPNGVDAVLGLVDDADAIKKTAAVLGSGGRIVSTTGAVDENWFAQRKIAAQDLYTLDSPHWSHVGLRTLLELLEQGRLRVMIAGERPLADAVAALEASRSGSVNGKLVITVDTAGAT